MIWQVFWLYLYVLTPGTRGAYVDTTSKALGQLQAQHNLKKAGMLR